MYFSDPQWASTNFGTLLCIECSGIHRSLGVHVSKVKSLMLDKWEPESIEVMLRLGNAKANQIYEANVDIEKSLLTTNWDRYNYIVDDVIISALLYCYITIINNIIII